MINSFIYMKHYQTLITLSFFKIFGKDYEYLIQIEDNLYLEASK